jgi:hypothetical protein
MNNRAGLGEPITGEKEALEALEQAVSLYDLAASLVTRVALGQESRGGDALPVGAHLNAAADAHVKAKAALLLAVIAARKAVERRNEQPESVKYTRRRRRSRGNRGG